MRLSMLWMPPSARISAKIWRIAAKTRHPLSRALNESRRLKVPSCWSRSKSAIRIIWVWTRRVWVRVRRGRIGRTGNGTATVDPSLLFASDETPSRVALEQRVADVLAAYDAQGNHRTGTPTDRASAEWLAKTVQQLGAEPEL